MKKIIYSLAIALACFACNDDDPIVPEGGATGGISEVTTTKSELNIDLFTDKACYNPGETVQFTATGTIPAGTKIRYRHLGETIEETSLIGSSWSWTAPSSDFKGYMVELYVEENGTEIIKGIIAVDISSDWKKFPRYGFVAEFEDDKTEEVIEKEMAYLNRHHINGVQFQDWHNKHHWPLGGTRNNLDEVYTDIANRPVYTSVIKNYIKTQHAYGMKSIFYNLCFGALDDAAEDGVKEEWYIFKNANQTNKDSHDLPSSWKSNIYLLDPGNPEWLEYIAERNDDVYYNFDFDGFQIDQLGSRGTRYNYAGNTIKLPERYAIFIDAMAKAHPEKRLLMNAVSSYGAKQIVETGKLDFLYNEVWASEADFMSLRGILYANDVYSNGELNTVFAAYMNYNIAEQKGEFNTPGVVLTDAVMFALGGSHLELGGDHMLCKEYFPNSNLTMKEDLKQAMIHYYDFMTAYQNLLRDGGTENEVKISCTNNKFSANYWKIDKNPELGQVNTLSKEVNGKQVIHLLNFINATSVSWRDLDGTTPEPAKITEADIQLQYAPAIKKIWMASPDEHGGASVELAFTQKDGVVSLTLPSLKYWSMLVIE